MNRPFMILCGCVLVASLLAPHGAHAQNSLLLPTGIRSYGMAETGVADPGDPTNAFYNPATLFLLRRAFFTVNGTNFPSSDVTHLSIGASGGHGLSVSPRTTVGVGGDLRYTKLDAGIPAFDIFERYYGISVAAGISVDDLYHIGLGASIKPFKIRDVVGFPFPSTSELTTTAYDVGFLASSRIEQTNGTMHITIGVSALNLGGAAEGSAPPFIVTSELPEEVRAGLGLRFTGLQHAGLTRWMGTPVAAFSAAFNIEYEKPQSGSTEVVRGGFEVGVLSLVYLRVGFLDELDTGFSSSPAETTFGLGLNFPHRRGQTRLDFARFNPGGVAIHRFGGMVAFAY